MGRSVKTDLCGFLNIAKPAGVTAHDVVAALRKIIGTTQVGHGGTLDPMATGVLPIAIGKATRLLRFLPSDKTYLAEIKLGLQTTTDDITGDTISQSSAYPDEATVREALMRFSGPITQLPPLYSAVHVGGKRLYELARQGLTPDTVPERRVIVHSLELLAYEPPLITARIACSAGTYIRSIARDLGQNLGCGGCLSALSREQAGPFHLTNALSIDELRVAKESQQLEQVLVKPESILPLHTYQIDELQAQRLMKGQALSLQNADHHQEPTFVLAIHNSRLIAVCLCSTASSDHFVKMQPEVVLADGPNPVI